MVEFIYKLYPTRAQSIQLNKDIDICCDFYNYFIDIVTNNDTLKTKNDMISLVPQSKKDNPEFKKIYHTVLYAILFVLEGIIYSTDIAKVKHYDKKEYNSMYYYKKGFEIKENSIDFTKIGNIKSDFIPPTNRVINGVQISRTDDGYTAQIILKGGRSYRKKIPAVFEYKYDVYVSEYKSDKLKQLFKMCGKFYNIGLYKLRKSKKNPQYKFIIQKAKYLYPELKKVSYNVLYNILKDIYENLELKRIDENDFNTIYYDDEFEIQANNLICLGNMKPIRTDIMNLSKNEKVFRIKLEMVDKEFFATLYTKKKK